MDNSLSSTFFDLSPVTKEAAGERLRANMDMLKKQDVYEHTLYKKWKYLQGFTQHHNRSEVMKAKIWTPSDIHDQSRTVGEIESLQPVLRYVDTRQAYDAWFTLKVFLSSFPPTMPPGRVLNFILEDEVSGQYLGVATIASDVINLGARDRWIGWTTENKLDDGKLQCSPTAHMIISTQPFGYNFLGGKLIASLLTTKQVRDLWKEVTGKPLAGLTTTGLYGASAQYNGIPCWKTLGESVGQVLLIPDDEIYEECLQWVRARPEYVKMFLKMSEKDGPVTNAKQKTIKIIFKEMEIKISDYMHGFRRGVFYAPLYSNGREFLRSEIDESQLILSPRLKRDSEGVLDWWKPKAVKRYLKLSKENRLKPEIMYYTDMLGMTWEEAKERYVSEVGR